MLGIFQSQAEIDSYVDANGNKIQPDAVPGDIKFLDYNGDGKISTDDRHCIGDMDPLFTINFSNTLSWKNFSLYFTSVGMQVTVLILSVVIRLVITIIRQRHQVLS